MNEVLSRCLPMVDAEIQVLGRAGISASSLHVTSTGTVDAACDLLPKVLHWYFDQAFDQASLPDLDHFAPESLAANLVPAISTLAALSDPGLEPEEQKQRLAVIAALRANSMLDLGRDVMNRARDIVRKQEDAIRNSLLHTYSVSPAGVKGVINDLRAALERTRLGEPNWQTLARWQELHRIVDKLRQRRGKLPATTYKAATDAISGKVRELYGQAVAAIAIEHIQPAWQDAKTRIIKLLDETAKRSTEAVHARTAVLEKAEAIRAAVAAEQYVSRASVVCPVPGPTKDQVLAGLNAQLTVPDEAALVGRLAEAYDVRLRGTCREVCPWLNPQAPLPDLLRAFPPLVLAQQFQALIEETKGPGQSFYESVDRQGVEECIEFLYRRSQPTVDLSGRDQYQVGVTPTALCIVSLPKPFGPNDHAIVERIRGAFLKHFPNCALVDAAPTDRTITVVRLLVGFPIVIEGQTANLLDHYLVAAKHGHLPHLFDLLPESTEGKALEEYCALEAFALQRKEIM